MEKLFKYERMNERYQMQEESEQKRKNLLMNKQEAQKKKDKWRKKLIQKGKVASKRLLDQTLEKSEEMRVKREQKEIKKLDQEERRRRIEKLKKRRNEEIVMKHNNIYVSNYGRKQAMERLVEQNRSADELRWKGQNRTVTIDNPIKEFKMLEKVDLLKSPKEED